ncbi:alpha-L-rhamnosidase [Microbacterium sp. W4I20]|uniref:alpha-L-rhamnosidase n=1 Tax=Microbacterium sp. W4I20 TaxID=3042262 RepID=UPI002784D204|nr:alpha-L-rhamnosidase [Microbacterium sp. W4I20]MDQ0726708.1 alpha-L-rhamnosidase [Microbacterium sp. W4I20]
MKVNAAVAVRNVKVENHDTALGIDEANPRLSFTVSAPMGWQQASYDLELRGADGLVNVTGPVMTSERVYVSWPTAPLRHREHHVLRIRVRGEDGDPSPWSDPLPIERGPSRSGWVACPISASWLEEAESDRRPSLLRTTFTVGAGVSRALLRVTAHGLYELEFNGARVGRDALSPGWSVYGERLRYATYDVTAQVRSGANALGAWLGDGWYRGRLGFNGGNRNIYGSDLSLILQLELRYADGREEITATDSSWRSHPSPIHFSDIYDGERYDARDELDGWSMPTYDDSSWGEVTIGERDPRTLVAPDGPPVRATEDLMPASVTRIARDRMIVDFGQNLSGRTVIQATGQRGESVAIRHAEVLQDGEIYTRPLRLAKATDRYVFRDSERVTWEPKFTYHGFRYAEVVASPDTLDSLSIIARVYHSAMQRVGWFSCSNENLNRLHQNVVWSMRSNFVDVPTDCPQRDERFGWTGDIQVFAPTAAFLFDVSGMLAGWLRDLAIEQLPDGTVPWYVPTVPGRAVWTPPRPGAAWGDAAVLVPWDLWFASGDVQILVRQWDSARAWVDLMMERCDVAGLWTGDFQLGDWLDPAAPPESPAEAMTDRDLVASAYCSWSSRVLARTAEVLGKVAESEHYSRLSDQVAQAIRLRYLDDVGTLHQESQTGYAMLICFELVDGEQREHAGRRLRALVEDADFRISTGFVGTPLVSRALTETGSVDTAYRQLLEEELPSWLYAVTQGATTIWERWDSLMVDGRVNPGQMTSFNHYALGSVAHWMHTTVAGIELRAPGAERVRFAPKPGGGLTWAAAELDSPRGRIAIRWDLVDDGTVSAVVAVPEGVVAEFLAPDGSTYDVSSGVSRVSFSA